MKSEEYDFAVVGSGFGGAILSMVLRRLGKTVLLIERGSHPRFVIGESSTPFANLLLERISENYDLPFLKSLSEWGSWRERFPTLAVGLKRGFTFFHHTPSEAADLTDRAKQLLVAASPDDRVADTHWYRPEFDQLLVGKAIELGIHFSDRSSILNLRQLKDRWSFTIDRESETRNISASFMVDATGPTGFLTERLSTRAGLFPTMPATSGVFAHFRDVARMDEIAPESRNSALPYPVDDAALHHVFPGGWIWVLRFNNGITSAGAAFSRDAGLNLAQQPESIWIELLKKFPTLGRQFSHAKMVTPFYGSPRLSFRRAEVAGENWALLPSTAGFVDPLLSTGFALTLLGVLRLGKVFGGCGSLKQYKQQTLIEMDAAADVVGALYAKMGSPEEFGLLSLLYFAAMSYTETAWRLGKEELASGFLLTNHSEFTANRIALCKGAREGAKVVRSMIENAIAPFDVAGLRNWERRNWYPVDLRDLVLNADKLGASRQDLDSLFAKLRLPFPDVSTVR